MLVQAGLTSITHTSIEHSAVHLKIIMEFLSYSCRTVAKFSWKQYYKLIYCFHAFRTNLTKHLHLSHSLKYFLPFEVLLEKTLLKTLINKVVY